MTGLIDFDSILYRSVYRIVGYAEIKQALIKLGKENAKQWLYEQVLHEGVNRTENILLEMQTYIQSISPIEIDSWEIYITTCTKNFRKKISKEYKANRKRNNYVWLLRNYYMNNGAFYSDTLEADDLIANRVNELGRENSVIISIDKDMKTVGGYYWSYMKGKQKDENGNYIVIDSDSGEVIDLSQENFKLVKDENKNFNVYYLDELIAENVFFQYGYLQDEIIYITKEQADIYFYSQMLIGDGSDNIKGIEGIGVVKAKKVLESSSNPFIATAKEYIKRGLKERFLINRELLKIGTYE
jgi:5'-3' exonuclease